MLVPVCQRHNDDYFQKLILINDKLTVMAVVFLPMMLSALLSQKFFKIRNETVAGFLNLM